ncbi:sigma-70 family RNA polymerase sigma factor [Pedobacter frigoris]|uniref:RNA polymerase sigma factor n=1 Tax=Pedobacter frigoris TaxID=2571272 RepID=UPI00292E9B10|nr:sigma-70 family RNA polymerase sigma factor [Pedobacter frigoris]
MNSDFENLQLLWQGLREGKEQSLFSLYKTLYNPLFNYGFISCREKENVEDAINQMFLELWENRVSLKQVINVKSYLFTYLRRNINKSKAIESRQIYQDVAQYEQSILDYIVELQLEEEIKSEIFKAINKLTSRQKQLIMLKFYENMDYDEISEKTGLVTQTVYNNIHQAIKFLRKELKIPMYILVFLLKK